MYSFVTMKQKMMEWYGIYQDADKRCLSMLIWCLKVEPQPKTSNCNVGRAAPN
jgi:hypothetical protein